MSNSQWHNDQALGERVQRQHDQRVSAVDDLVEACRDGLMLGELLRDILDIKQMGGMGRANLERIEKIRAALLKAGVEP